MTDVHRLLLQYFIECHVEKEPITREKLHGLCEYYQVEQMDLEAAVATINHNMHFLWLEVRRVVDEQTGEAWYGIANTQADEAAKLATSYTEREIEFLKKLIEAIVESGGMINPSQLANAVPSGMSKAESKDTSAAFIADHWLSEPKSNHISLGVRALLELRSYIEESFPDQLHECVFCHELVVLGEGCPNPKCNTRAHFHCLRRYSEGKGRGKGKLKCPACTLEWTPGQGKTGPAPQINVNSSSKKRRIAQSEDEGEEEEELVEEQVDGDEEEEVAEED